MLRVLFSLVLCLGYGSMASADLTPNEKRAYTITAINGFDLDAVRRCQKNNGRLFISQYASKNLMENASWLCVTGNLIYPLVGEPIVIIDHHP